MTIYLIEGETGEYEDRLSWISKAFTNKQLAESTMDIWQQYVNGHRKIATTHNSPDPYFSTSYTGTFYRIIEIELITDPFMESVLTTTKR